MDPAPATSLSRPRNRERGREVSSITSVAGWKEGDAASVHRVNVDWIPGNAAAPWSPGARPRHRTTVARASSLPLPCAAPKASPPRPQLNTPRITPIRAL
ncbi:hypothetical protein DAI22_06g164100 [Oryza sativa Japonica Group]|nr:hypothetical protein DAI22_06g164100 [Oryza sativa Japonica Group]